MLGGRYDRGGFTRVDCASPLVLDSFSFGCPASESPVRLNLGLHRHLAGSVHFRVGRSAVEPGWPCCMASFSFSINPVSHFRVVLSSFLRNPLPPLHHWSNVTRATVEHTAHLTRLGQLRRLSVNDSYILYLHVHEASFSPFPITSSSKLSTRPPMSHTHPTSASSSNFQLIFDNALKAYQRRTKKDLLTHPLAVHLQHCDSPSSILDLLQQEVQDLNQSQRRNERWTRWLDPTVKVLYAFSETLGKGVTVVCLSS